MKRGIVYITPELWHTQPEIRAIVAKEFLILKLERMDYEHWYRILIEDERLDVVEEAEPIPRYDIMIKRDEKGNPLFDEIVRHK